MYSARICRYNSIDLIEDITPQERCLLYRLNGLSNENGECYPSIETMAKDLKVSATSIHRYIKSLMNKGFISIQPRIKENGKQTSNLYKLTLPKVKNNLQEKIEELKETVKTMAKDTLPQTAPKRNNNKYNNKYNSKSKSLKQVRPRLEELEELKAVKNAETDFKLDKKAMQTFRKVLHSIVTSNRQIYELDNKYISKQTIIDKLKTLTMYDIKTMVNAITGKKIKFEFAYILKTLYNYQAEQSRTENHKKSDFCNIELQDYDFDLLEKVCTKGYI